MSTINPEILARANGIMHSNSSIIGKDWWNSPVKRIYEQALTTAIITNPAVVSLLLYSLARAYQYDRHKPWVTLNRCHPHYGTYQTYKVRTMKVGSENIETDIQSIDLLRGTDKSQDPRITPPGKFLRKTSLDEIPGLFTVLGPNIALVGPRNPLYSDYQTKIYPYKTREPYKSFVDNLEQGWRYGITGLAVLLARGSSLDDNLTLNNLHAEKASFIAEARILALTLLVPFQKTGA
jgi:lipopolysaccharide/colanic/teichoic acid biosynthesis glycosyltransferase